MQLGDIDRFFLGGGDIKLPEKKKWFAREMFQREKEMNTLVLKALSRDDALPRY